MIRLMLKGWSKEDKIFLCSLLSNCYITIMRMDKCGTILSKAFANCISWLEDDIDKTE